MLKVWKKSWEPFGSCLLNSTANSAKLGWKWAGLAMLFISLLPNGTHDFFQIFRMYFLNCFIKNPQTTIALTFLTHIISAIGGVSYHLRRSSANLCIYLHLPILQSSWVTRQSKQQGCKIGVQKFNLPRTEKIFIKLSQI